METMVERCCGLDVHKEEVTACVLLSPAGQKQRKETRKFTTFTSALVDLAEWLRSNGVTHVVMESTGVYWKPVYAVLETAGAFELIVGNAQHMKNVPGRKTDMADAEWIANLGRWGLIRKSYVPPQDLRELRDLVRYRQSLVRTRSTERNRLQKVLESANVKLGSVATDVLGMSGTAIIEAMVAGETEPKKLAQLAKGLLRKKIPELELALDGKILEHHRKILAMQLGRLKAADTDVETLDAEIEARLGAYRKEESLLSTIPGVKRVVAAALIAEMGVKMSIFPTAGHLAAWAGVCPGNNESAGKNRRVTARKGNMHLRSVLVEAAWCAIRTKGSYWRNKYYRLKARRGHARAIMAIAHKMLVAAYNMLLHGKSYADLTENYLDRVDQNRSANNLLRRLERLGFDVAIQRKQAPAP